MSFCLRLFLSSFDQISKSDTEKCSALSWDMAETFVISVELISTHWLYHTNNLCGILLNLNRMCELDSSFSQTNHIQNDKNVSHFLTNNKMRKKKKHNESDAIKFHWITICKFIFRLLETLFCLPRFRQKKNATRVNYVRFVRNVTSLLKEKRKKKCVWHAILDNP